MLNREQFCQLANVSSIHNLKARAQRDQLPVSTNENSRKSYGYSVFDVFTTLLADDLSGGVVKMNAVAAASVAKEIAPTLAQKWPSIVATALLIRDGVRTDEIEWQIVYRPMGDGDLKVAGTAIEIIAARSDGKPAINTIGGNASRIAALLLARAAKFEIALSEDELSTIPKFNSGEYRSNADAWAAQIDKVNAGATKDME